MGCGCNDKKEIILTDKDISDMKELNIDDEIKRLFVNGFNTNRIAAMLLVNKEYVESALAPKPTVKTSKKKKSE